MKIGDIGELALDQMRGRVTQEVEGLEAFALHLLAADIAWRETQKMALNKAAKLIKEDARAQIGEYQDAVGNYPAWAPLAESTEDEKARLGAPPDAPLLRFGDLQKSFRSTLVGHDELIVGSTDLNMEWHEFGTVKMPPRPVLGPALLKNMPAIQVLLGGALVEAMVSGQRLGYRFNQTGGIGELED